MINTGVELGFYKFLEKYKKISIPKIQRDYVQGRPNVRIERNRKKFIEKLVEAVCQEEKQVSLNFIYGYSDENEAFIPIDGQQRLTTLLLLHAYVFASYGDTEALEMLGKKFSYETRDTSKKFFESLLEKSFIDLCKIPKDLSDDLKQLQQELWETEKKIIECPPDELEALLNEKATKKEKIEESKQKQISNRIENCYWFAARWKQDPTVMSALVVLDEIEASFTQQKNVDFLSCKNALTSEKPPISFMVLNIANIGKPEELYIKMNARGKQLTPFENFKADLYGELKEDSEENKRFKKKIDGDWLDLIWQIVGEDYLGQNPFEIADVFYRDVFHWIFTTRLVNIFDIDGFRRTEPKIRSEKYQVAAEKVRKVIGSVPTGNTFEEIYYSSKEKILQQCNENYNIDDCCLEDYLNGSESNFYHCIKDFEDFFDLLKELAYEDEEMLKEVTNSLFKTWAQERKMTYPQRVLMFSVIKYRNKKNGTDNFKRWWKVFKNLVVNTTIDKIDPFCSALRAIEIFDGDMVSSDIKEMGMFDRRQLAEEYLKLKLIEQNETEWAQTIAEIESENPYFKGQIYFSFKLICNDLDFLTPHNYEEACKKIDEIVSNNQIKKEKLVNIWKSISELFQEKGLSEELDNRDSKLFRRALLTFGNYSIETQRPNKYTFFFEGGKNYYDWRRMLSEKNSFPIFEKFIVAFEKSGQEAKEFTETCINKYSGTKYDEINHLNEEMIYYLIKKQEIFGYMGNYNYFEWDDEKERIILLSSDKLSSNYAEMKTYILNVVLPQKSKYIAAKGEYRGTSIESAHVELDGQRIEGDQIELCYENSYHIIKVNGESAFMEA